MSPSRRRAIALAVGAAVAVAVTAFAPAGYGRWQAGAWYDVDGGDLARALSEGVGATIDAGVGQERFSTGAELFDQEWVFGTHVLGAVGIGQVALAEAEAEAEAEAVAEAETDPRARDLARIDRCLDVLLSDSGSAFDTRAWGAYGLDDPNVAHGHAAWLGYGGLAFAMRERLAPGGPHAADGERVIAQIRARLAQMGPGGVETYPGERYPVDQSALIGALGLWAEARGEPIAPEAASWTALARERFVDPDTGLLRQAVDPAGTAGQPRGSGTFLAAYFLSFADPALSRALYEAGRRELRGGILGFGMMREYPRGVFGLGDIDSGPVLLGYGVSSTGFAIGAARANGDRATFRSLVATAWLFGAPIRDADRLRFTTGGPLGDALLFAMLTARRPEGRRPEGPP